MTQVDFDTLHQLISKICHRNISQLEVERFANICLRMAAAYLRILERRGQRIRETNNEEELQGIAADCIADLFARNEEGTLIYVRRYFAPRLSNCHSGEELFPALRTLITSKVQQHLTRIFSQRDPEGAKLLRNVRLSVQRHEELKLTKDISGEYVLLLPKNQIPGENDLVHRPDCNELECAAALVFLANLSINQMVLELLRELSSRRNQAVEVPLSELIILIRHFRESIQHRKHTHTESDPLSAQRQLELKRVVAKILDTLGAKINSNYVGKNKLTLEQGIAMFSALQDMANDALMGNRLKENFSHLQKHWSSLTRKEYLASTRKVFEYFVRQFKNAIRKKLT